MKGLFKKVPPKELVEEILIHLQFLGFNDNRLFTKYDISREKFEDIITWIEPYYIPCKAKRFLYDINENKQITILRHILRAHKYDLNAQEKLVNTIKTTTYQLKINVEYNDLSGDYVMEFN
jgi:hypothetical protein